MPVLFSLTVAFFTIITIAGFSFVVRGMLGVRFSLWRLIIAGILAFQIGEPSLQALVGREAEESVTGFPRFLFVLLGVSSAVLVGMVFLVIAEAIVPSNTLPGPIYMVRAFRRWLNRSARYWQINRIMLRYGLWAYLRGGRRAELRTTEGRSDLARSLRRALDDGGVTFVKLGQVLSTRRDLMPAEFIDELSGLQFHAASVQWEGIETTLRTSLGEDVDSVFESFDREPLAAASIAQVHAARLLNNEDVVVKIRRPEIMSQVERDLDIAVRLARTLQRSTEWGRGIGVVDLANGFAMALREELDFRVEARNLAVIGAAVATRGGDRGLYVPKVYAELSSERVLVMERIAGVPLGETASVIAERGLDGTLLARNLLNSLLRQIVIDGTFHADPHPGNVMLLEDNRLTLLDFGSVGRIDVLLRQALIRLILAFDHGDPMAAADALLDLVERPDVLDHHRLERALGRFMARHLTPGIAPDVRMFTDLFRVIAEFGLAVPPEVAAVFRAISTLDGTLKIVVPDFNIVSEARGFASAYLSEQLQPRVIRKTLTDELTDLLPLIRGMPRRLDRLTSALEEGRLNVNLRPSATERERRAVSGLVHEALLTILASTSGIMAAILVGHDGGPRLTEIVSLFQFIGYLLLVVGSMLAMRVLVLIFRPVRG